MGDGVDDGLQFLVLLGELGRDALQLFLVGLALGDVGADGDVLERFAGRVDKRADRRIDPIKGPVFGAVANLTPPDPALGQCSPEIAEKFLGMRAGIDDAVILPDEFFPANIGKSRRASWRSHR